MPRLRDARLVLLLGGLLLQPVLGEVIPDAPELLIRWAPGAARPAAALDSLHVVSGLRSIEAILPLSHSAPRLAPRRAGLRGMDRWTRLRFDGRLSMATLLARYQNIAGVEAIQLNYTRRQTLYSTDDPLLDDQWNLDAVGWRSRDPGSADGVVVAIIDSGVDDDHPDLAPRIWRNAVELAGLLGVDDDLNGYIDDVVGWDFTDAPGLPGDGDFLDPDADPDDESGHGTHVAGIVAAVSDNGIGISGVAPGASIMVLRAGFNIGSTGYLQDDDIAAAIVYAADNGAQVINLSLGDPRYSPLLADAVRYATDLDVVVVAAAGNESSSSVYYPARLDETIGVAAAGRNGLPAAFSNRGSSIDLIAPGVAVLSAQPGGGYGNLSGTSMASPHVAAAAALVRARHPEYSRLQVLGLLVATAVDVGTPGWDETTGHGLLQLPAPSAIATLAIAFRSPPTDRPVRGAFVDLEIDYEASVPADYHIDWGPGRSPQSWNKLDTGSVAPGAGVLATQWPTQSLAPALYTLRVQLVDSNAGTHEDRVLLNLVGAGAQLSNVRLLRVLQGPRWRDVVEWTTDREAPGLVEVLAADDVVLRVSVPEAETAHVVILPEDLAPGDYAVRVSAGPGATVVQESLRVHPTGVQRWDLDLLPEILPDGYLLPAVTDFDGDGRSELVAMVYGGGTYGATSFFEQDQILPVYTTTRLFIPWETGDFDLDGVQDLLAVDARRVRVFEPSTPGSYPDRVAWERRDVWGGEVADLDGDGRPEMILRSATGPLFRVVETNGEDSFLETAALVNDTPGENEMGDRQSVGDLDGDGRGEWISGDSDGDLIIFESGGDDIYRQIWSDVIDATNIDATNIDATDIDGRLLSAAADLDGDGDVEFVSGRLTQDPFDVEGRRWTLTVYGSTGDNDYGIEWQTQVVAASATGNGLAITDLDGDGRLEWVAALVPHLYVFQSDGVGGYAPVWHTNVRRTQRPAVGDLDGDGRQELAYNRAAGGLETVRLRIPEVHLSAPTGWAAASAGPDRARLSWERVSGAGSYRLRRDGADVGSILDTGRQSYAQVDSGLSTGQRYAYDVVAVDSSGATGHRSRILTVMPGNLPTVVGIRRSSSHQLSIDFDQPMAATTAEPFRYSLLPDVATPQAVIFDRSGRRAVVTFSSALPQSGVVSLRFSGLRSAAGAPLNVGAVDVTLAPLVAGTRLHEAAATSPTAIVAVFDRPVVIDAAVVIVDGGAIVVESVRLTDHGTTVEIQLSDATPLRPLGRPYEVAIAGLTDDLGRAISVRAFVTLEAAALDEVLVFPNPFDPRAHSLSVAGLPAGTRVYIYALSGDLVWSSEEADGDGGLQWNGRNTGGERVAAGIYVLLATHGGRSLRTRFAILPGR